MNVIETVCINETMKEHNQTMKMEEWIFSCRILYIGVACMLYGLLYIIYPYI